MSVADYNSDPNANTSISGINIAEGCPPSGINDAIRQIMADVKVADGGYVKTTGNQTIAGEKMFTDSAAFGSAGMEDLTISGGSAYVYGENVAGVVSVEGIKSSSGGASGYGVELRSNLNGQRGLYDPQNAKWITVTNSAGTATFSGTATNASSLGGVVASSYALAADVVKLSGDQAVGGVKTFTSPIVITDNDVSVCRSNTTGALRLTGGNSTLSDEGAMLSLFGSGHSALAGYFRIYTGGAVHPYVEGRPSGKLTWDGKDILCVSESGSNYIRFSNGLQICWGSVTISTASTGLAVTFPKAFSATPNITFGLRPGSVSTKLYNVLAYPRSSTGFTAYANDAAGHMAAAASYIAIGSWA